jgi:type IV pilus assembly protein PilY1
MKDRNENKTLDHGDLVEVTDFYDWNEDKKTNKLNDIKSKYGWYIALDSHKKDDFYGEKCLASPVVYNKIAYFTTFAPSQEAVGDPCFIGEGTAQLYAFNYATGEAALNLDLTNDTGGGTVVVKGKSDRAKLIGSAIPSGVVITVIGGKVTSYIGVGGGVVKPPMSSTRSLFPVTWKLVF